MYALLIAAACCCGDDGGPYNANPDYKPDKPGDVVTDGLEVGDAASVHDLDLPEVPDLSGVELEEPEPLLVKIVAWRPHSSFVWPSGSLGNRSRPQWRSAAWFSANAILST